MRDFAKTTQRAATSATVLAILVAGCASNPSPPVTPAQPEPVQQDRSMSDDPGYLQVRSVDLVQEGRDARIDVETSGALVWTTYRDGEDRLVVELPNSMPSQPLEDLSRSEGLVESVKVEVEDGERPLTRLVVQTRVDAEHSVVADSGRLRVDLAPIVQEAGSTSMSEGTYALASLSDPPNEYVTAAAPVEPYPAEPVTPTPMPAAAEEPAYAALPQPMQEEPQPAAGAEPERSPVYEPDGVPATQLQRVEISHGDSTTAVRVLGDGEFYYSTFSLDAPDRYVVDLIGVANATPQSTYLGSGDLVERVRVAQFKPQPELVARVVIDLTAPAVPQLTALPDGLLLTFGAGGVADSTLFEDVSEAAPQQPAAAEMPTQDVSPAPMQEPAMQEPAAPAMEPPTAPMPMAEPQMPPPATAAEPMDMSHLERGAAGEGAARTQYQSLDVTGEKKYFGEPMTISLKDADIKDLLRSFAQISGLNIVIQPGVSGTVTVELTDVPWDQALEQVLKINQLGYELEGNIMRIAPVSQLRAEAEEEQRLRAAQAQAVPLSMVVKRISYATASDVARVLRSGANSVLSRRGSVVVDGRTNTLIITELPTFIDNVISVIETLDIPEPQVQIEARIIETTKRFTRQLGINWGFGAIADAAHGNTTGLVFPNNGTVDGRVDLAAPGNGTLDITLGNVLNTFQLDVALQAAENEGLINILSAPKITTLNNEAASIQSGLQIPIQTIANNTVSVQFVNATLRLQVTPHVTAEGTVLMDIDIQKREPLLGLAVQGAANAPISTKDASTRVIVRDGGTTVIGGIYEVTTDEGEDRVPGLYKVPILKHLFKSARQTEENEELLIFITPRVVKL